MACRRRRDRRSLIALSSSSSDAPCLCRTASMMARVNAAISALSNGPSCGASISSFALRNAVSRPGVPANTSHTGRFLSFIWWRRLPRDRAVRCQRVCLIHTDNQGLVLIPLRQFLHRADVPSMPFPEFDTQLACLFVQYIEQGRLAHAARSDDYDSSRGNAILQLLQPGGQFPHFFRAPGQHRRNATEIRLERVVLIGQ